MMRSIIHITLICVIVGGWFSSPARAFSLSLGPLPTSAETTTTSEASDLPTPQFFRVALDARRITLGVLPAAIGYSAPTIAVQRQVVHTPQQPAPLVHNVREATSRRLRGVEVFLLQHTETVASEQTP